MLFRSTARKSTAVNAPGPRRASSAASSSRRSTICCSREKLPPFYPVPIGMIRIFVAAAIRRCRWAAMLAFCAVLLTARAMATEENDRDTSRALALEAVKLAPDLVLAAAESSFARESLVELLTTPHLRVAAGGLTPDAIREFDQVLREQSYIGDITHLATIVEAWTSERSRPVTQVAQAALLHLEVHGHQRLR